MEKYFVKHDLQENNGRYEVVLYLDKKYHIHLESNDFPSLLKKTSISYINEKLTAIPVEVVRIWIGSVPYFSFAVKKVKKNHLSS